VSCLRTKEVAFLPSFFLSLSFHVPLRRCGSLEVSELFLEGLDVLVFGFWFCAGGFWKKRSRG
jgi:hypothetical protein